MKKALDQVEANKTWNLIHKKIIGPRKKLLGENYVYKVKRNINGDIARLKARQINATCNSTEYSLIKRSM